MLICEFRQIDVENWIKEASMKFEDAMVKGKVCIRAMTSSKIMESQKYKREVVEATPDIWKGD